MIIAERMNTIAERRLALGLTQKDVAEHLKQSDARMDISMVSKFETGVCQPTDEIWSLLAEYLQTPEAQLRGSELKHRSENEERMEQVLSHIPFGADNAIKRTTLTELTGLTDRTVRKAIEAARFAGYIIVNDNDGRGYYQTDNIDVIERQYKRDTARALCVLARRKKMRAMLKAAGRKV